MESQQQVLKEWFDKQNLILQQQLTQELNSQSRCTTAIPDNQPISNASVIKLATFDSVEDEIQVTYESKVTATCGTTSNKRKLDVMMNDSASINMKMKDRGPFKPAQRFAKSTEVNCRL